MEVAVQFNNQEFIYCAKQKARITKFLLDFYLFLFLCSHKKNIVAYVPDVL